MLTGQQAVRTAASSYSLLEIGILHRQDNMFPEKGLVSLMVLLLLIFAKTRGSGEFGFFGESGPVRYLKVCTT